MTGLEGVPSSSHLLARPETMRICKKPSVGMHVFTHRARLQPLFAILLEWFFLRQSKEPVFCEARPETTGKGGFWEWQSICLGRKQYMFSHRPCRILIIEDDPADREIYKL